MSQLRLLMWSLFSLACLFCALDCARISAAEYFAAQGNDDSLSRAVRVWPLRADFYRHLAVLQPDRATDWLSRAMAVNPRDARATMHLGLQAEADGDFPRAERLLLDAVKLDRTYEPRWTLCNYYFRRNDSTRFWESARTAAADSAENLMPLFDLCWRSRPDAEKILHDVVPEKCNSQRQFFEYLISARLDKEARPVASRMVGCANPQTRTELIHYTDWLFFHSLPKDAWKIWTGLKVSGEESDVAAGNEGFVWHNDATQGVSVRRDSLLQTIHVSFNGTEPEAMTVLYRPLLSEPGGKYELSCDLASPESSGLPNGFRWRLVDITAGTRGSDTGPIEGLAGNHKWRFQATYGPSLVLALEYARPQGASRFRGSLDLRRFSVNPVSLP